MQWVATFGTADFREELVPEAQLPRKGICTSCGLTPAAVPVLVGSGAKPLRKHVKRVLRFRARLNGKGTTEVELATVG
jgi:hypothetical protein